MEQWTGKYPGNAGIAGGAKGELPRRLKRLEILVGLEEGAQGQSVEEAPGQQQGGAAWCRGRIVERRVRHWVRRDRRWMRWW